MNVAIIDDSETNIAIFSRLVRAVNAEPVAFGDASMAALVLPAQAVDLIVVDFEMPTMNGVEVISALRGHTTLTDVPIVMITANDDRAVRHQALSAGATDFIKRPIDPVEVKSRLKNLLNLRQAQVLLADYAAGLEAAVARATRVIAEREEEIIMRLAAAAEHRDCDTGDHIGRMARYCEIIAHGLKLSREQCRMIYLAAPMHDVGKIGIRDEILLKPGNLSAVERDHMETHTLLGEKILSGSASDLIGLACLMAGSHHERWDGTGYPRRLVGEAIPLAGRIAAVADVFDALTSERPYKKAWSFDEARAVIVAERGKHFDPACVDAFVANWDQVVGARKPSSDSATATHLAA